MADDNGRDAEGGGGEGEGGPAVRPIFFGNLSHGCMASDVEGIFEHPVCDVRGGMEDHGEFSCSLLLFGCCLTCTF